MTHRYCYLFAALLSLLLAGCRPAPDAGEATISVTDALGRTVLIPRSVERVVPLAPNLTEIVFAAGAGAKLVGVTTVDNYPPAIEDLPRYSVLPVDFEAIVALKPDLVLATAQINTQNDASTFDALGLPVYFFSNTSLPGMLENIVTAGTLLGTPERAAAAVDSLEASIAALRRLTEPVDPRPETLFLIGDETLYAFGQGNYIHDVIALAGGQSITAEISANAPILDDEFVLTRKPEVIVGAFGEDYDPARLLTLHPTWDIVPAIREGRIYSFSPDYFLRPTPRLLEGAWRMAARLHPALFPDDAQPPPPASEE